MTKATPFPAAEHRPIPKAIAYPSDYGLATATNQLVTEYGRDGAVNRLIEMAERLAAGENPLDWALRRKRVMPACYDYATRVGRQ